MPFKAARPMSKAARSQPFESALAGGLRPAETSDVLGSYSICSLRLGPAFVLTRLLDVLGRLDPTAHARLTAPGSDYRAIPSAAIDDPTSPWWSTPAGRNVLDDIVAAINLSAQPQYVCDLAPDSTIALVPSQVSAEGEAPSSSRRRKRSDTA